MSEADVLARHRKLWSDGVASCSGCDWTAFGTITRMDLAHAAHQLDALKAAGFAVVAAASLPGHDYDGCTTWPTSSAFCVRVFADAKRRIHVWDNGHPWNTLADPISPNQAHELAAALLAAADSAEANS